MPITKPTDEQFNLYVYFAYWLNANAGKCSANDAKYFDFLDARRVTHEEVARAVFLCHKPFEDAKLPFILHRDGRETGIKGGDFYLTRGMGDICFGLSVEQLPKLKYIEPQVQAIDILEQEEEDYPDEEQQWTKEQLITLLTTEAHMVGRMLGTGYDLLEPIHSEWIRNWILNPDDFAVTIHQAHRDSYKTTCLRLAIAILIILNPLLTIVVLRKSEDAVKELVNGVSKILDSPLFHTFVSILHPDILKKGGFKKTTDTALAIDTNLNTSLSGEFQLRALGLGSPLTGKHARLIITDDIVTTDDRESEAERRNTIMKYQELMNILSNNKGFSNARILNIGTPWHEEDAFSLMEKGLKDKSELQIKYEQIPSKDRTDKINEKIRRANMKRGLFIYNCYQTGLMTEESIAWKRRVLNDEALFAANYLLSLVSDKEKPFPKINNTGKYSKTFFADAWEVFAAIDAAYDGDDRTSLSIAALNWEEHEVVILGKMWKVALDENYLEVAEVMFECGVQKIFMENNTDKGLMGDKFAELGFIVDSYHESMNKHTKIVSTIRPYWRDKGANMLPSIQFCEETDKEYLDEIHGYKKGVKHDDAPDNLACVLLKGKFGALAVRVS